MSSFVDTCDGCAKLHRHLHPGKLTLNRKIRFGIFRRERQIEIFSLKSPTLTGGQTRYLYRRVIFR